MIRLPPRSTLTNTLFTHTPLFQSTKDEIRRFADRKASPEVNGDEWSERRILALALNWGNEGNREAILSQGRNRLTPEQVGAPLSRLDARDWAFVRDVWALIDEQWPAIAEAQRRRTGLVDRKSTRLNSSH